MKQTLILAVESSCDETAVAVVADGKEILSNVVATQIDVHKEFGGVIPEVASRIHVENISMVIEEALHKANVAMEDIDAVAVTQGPGLVAVCISVCRRLRRLPGHFISTGTGSSYSRTYICKWLDYGI